FCVDETQSSPAVVVCQGDDEAIQSPDRRIGDEVGSHPRIVSGDAMVNGGRSDDERRRDPSIQIRQMAMRT
ncbi:MAG: hypothetical protein E6848_39160, partial [Bradyrhizobium sp.]|nr:hypothetical protein [Bradyrhizobium sp.]